MKKTLALSAVLILGVLGAACPEPANNSNNTNKANTPANTPVNTATPMPVNTTNAVNNAKMDNTKDNTKADNTKTDNTKKP